MRKVLIYSGTTEGRELAEHLSAAGIECTVSVATEYGELVMPELPDDHRSSVRELQGREASH